MGVVKNTVLKCDECGVLYEDGRGFIVQENKFTLVNMCISIVFLHPNVASIADGKTICSSECLSKYMMKIQKAIYTKIGSRHSMSRSEIEYHSFKNHIEADRLKG